MKKIICIAATGVILITCVCVNAVATAQSAPAQAAVEEQPNKYVIKSEGGRLVVYALDRTSRFCQQRPLPPTFPKATPTGSDRE